MPRLPMLLAAILAQATALAAPLPQGGTISILVKAGDGIAPAGGAFVQAAGDALSDKGFTILPDADHAAYVGELTLTRTDVGTGTAKARTEGASILPGAGAGVGTGIVVPLPSGKSSLVPLQRSQIELRIRKRGDDEILWRGTAMTVRAAGTKKGVDEAVATDLSRALLAPYPAQAEGVVGVP